MADKQFNGTPEEWDALVQKNKKKQTAVQWLIDKLEIFATEDEMKFIDKALEMEKEQIMDAFEAAEKDCGRDFLHGDLYYNETFKSE